MIDPQKRKAVYLLIEEGVSAREISRKLNISRNTVKKIIKQKGEIVQYPRKDKIEINPELIEKLYTGCEGFVWRMMEVLHDEHNKKIGYSTLCRYVNELGLGKQKHSRCDRGVDEPGEMQHDTSDYKKKIGNKHIHIVASILYYRFSKIRYLKFYRSFNRFRMKCFLYEAIMFWEYCGNTMIIDNTNLARLSGTGKKAIIVDEMERFGDQFGFKFKCHERGHSNRKAGNERSFYTLETNFFPGRTFESIEDLNKQAFQWATQRMHNRPLTKLKIIPRVMFEKEKPYLTKVNPHICPPYIPDTRKTDEYGYIQVGANFYWVPGTSRNEVSFLQFSDCIKLYFKKKFIIEYNLPPDGTKNRIIDPPEGKPKSVYQPKHRKNPSTELEKKLKSISEEMKEYLKFVLVQKGVSKHSFIRKLYCLHQKIIPAIFEKTISRAMKYNITDIPTIEKIACLLLKQSGYTIPDASFDEDFRDRQEYIDGSITDDVDLSKYDNLTEDDDESENK